MNLLSEWKKKEEGEERRGEMDGGGVMSRRREEAWRPKVATEQFKLRAASRNLSIIKSHGRNFLT